jgi:hypothetical protein
LYNEVQQSYDHSVLFHMQNLCLSKMSQLSNDSLFAPRS